MDKKEAIEKINEIKSEALTWTANDGSLTMAASDILAFATAMQEDIENDNKDRLESLDPFTADTGLEGDLIDLALEFARS